MRCTGLTFDIVDDGTKITDAILTNTKVSMDYMVDDVTVHLQAASIDSGETYVGSITAPGEKHGCRVKMTRYRNGDGSAILFTRIRLPEGSEGDCIIRLSPR